MTRLSRILSSLAFLVLFSAGVTVGYRLVQQRMTNDIYRERLQQLSGEYEDLRSVYNEAVRRSAVTELIVTEDTLSVAIRTTDGQDRVIETPFHPSQEIYCDYLVMEGRLWIRRVYDDNTPPRDGIVIDPQVADVDWSDPNLKHGNAVYRALSEGRWIVTVTGDGSLGLVKKDHDDPTPLVAAPVVRDYETIEQQITDAVNEISPVDVITAVW